MNDTCSTYRSVVKEVREGACDFKKAAEMAFVIRDGWQKGKAVDLAAALEDHPELRQFKSIVLDLACDEYRIRCERGESLSAEKFAGRYPSLERSLCTLIEVQDLFSHDLDLQMLQGKLSWPEPGSSFLQFSLIAEIGRGTFGRVFLATEPALGNRLVALKVAPHGGEEAEILGRLQHPNIVPVYSVQEDPRTGLTAFCMPYLGRATLWDVLDHAFAARTVPKSARMIMEAVQNVNQDTDFLDLPPSDRVLRTGSYVDGVIHLAIQLADALAHAQRCGICHRDLKPSNVLLAPNGRPLLLDFNLSVDERFTPAKVGGTLPYMAPEVLAVFVQRGGVLAKSHYDPRSDFFSLGVIMYELLSGQLPFGPMPGNGSLLEVVQTQLDRQAKGPKPLREWNPQVDRGLSRLIESCLALDPDDRPEAAGQLAAALRKQLTPWRRMRRWVGCHRRATGVFAALATLALLVATAVAVTRPPFSIREYRAGAAYAAQGDYNRAIDHFSSALRANPAYFDALVARGHAYHRLAKYELAFADYNSASSLVPSAKVNACMAYCLNRMRQDRQAIVFYQKALDSGEMSPAILNNIGFACGQLARLDEAEKYLRQAIALDDKLLAPHYNLVSVFLNQALKGRPIAREAFDHARRAEELGPPSGNLFRDLAEFYAVAARRDASLVPTAIDHVRKAVQYGANPQKFPANSMFSVLGQDKAFQEALATPRIANPPTPARFIDPLDGEASIKQ